MLIMEELGLLESESLRVWEEAVQTAAHFLDIPICFLGLMEPGQQRVKSAVGLSRLGLMNELATSRQFPRFESFCTHVVDSHQVLSIENTLTHPAFANSTLTYRYGIQSYLGVPLITTCGFCIGTLAVMDLTPRQFTERDVEFLELVARWVMSECERSQSRRLPLPPPLELATPDRLPPPSPPADASLAIADQLRVKLLGQLTQELRTPLTSVMGMASVLTREIYGPLTDKQKEYLGIIHNSGQYLLSLVNEILELSASKDNSQRLNLASVDIEMLCQQAINTLEQAALRREQQIRLSVEPGRRIWLLDKDKIRQMLYHLVFSVIQASSAGSIVRLHVSHRSGSLTITIWVSHPWLGEGLPYVELYSQPAPKSAGVTALEEAVFANYELSGSESHGVPVLRAGVSTTELAVSDLAGLQTEEPGSFLSQRFNPTLMEGTYQHLGLLLSQYLAEIHNGYVAIQGSAESGYRYIIDLPQITESNEAG
ncbi:GAF domain-containing sensor histidine kinase [Kovacikia minuta CCNUW1]|uniref:GAF domain-containing sensor histidine kinase n=1 Tax=Kovacikia minuta TaxID=2931930 RepID=UPI001CCA8418|nr:GAF domain-containing sensor histidine kinase [Kovacikia minuta]UBF24642.1 GAF domain-containing sensor histidine kinase [Kovacikia minuta CCNUW1]